jgi:putative Holliday junction resolvase
MKRYMGLDLGSKTVGVSISESGIIASTLTTIRFTENNYEEAAIRVLELISTNKIDVVVLGLPKHMNNDIGIRGEISKQFKMRLEKDTTSTIVLWDERLSTKTAKMTMIQGSQRRSVQKEKKDELAAVIILQNYLDYKGA